MNYYSYLFSLLENEDSTKNSVQEAIVSEKDILPCR